MSEYIIILPWHIHVRVYYHLTLTYPEYIIILSWHIHVRVYYHLTVTYPEYIIILPWHIHVRVYYFFTLTYPEYIIILPWHIHVRIYGNLISSSYLDMSVSCTDADWFTRCNGVTGVVCSRGTHIIRIYCINLISEKKQMLVTFRSRPLQLIRALVVLLHDVRHSHAHARTLACTHARLHARMHTPTHARTHTYPYAHTNIYYLLSSWSE